MENWSSSSLQEAFGKPSKYRSFLRVFHRVPLYHPLNKTFVTLPSAANRNDQLTTCHDIRCISETGKRLFRRRSAVVTTLVEEALTTIAHVGRPVLDVREADIYKFGFKLAREIAELRGICKIAIQRQRKAWAKVTMATRDLEEDMFDSLVGYEEVTFRRKHAHAGTRVKMSNLLSSQRILLLLLLYLIRSPRTGFSDQFTKINENGLKYTLYCLHKLE